MTFFSFLDKGEVIKTVWNIPCELVGTLGSSYYVLFYLYRPLL